MKNSSISIVLGVTILLLVGYSLLLFIDSRFSLAVAPIAEQLNQSVRMDRDIRFKLNNLNSNGGADINNQLRMINQRLGSIEGRLIGIENRLNNAFRANPNPGGCGGSGGAAPQPIDLNKVYDIKVGSSPVLGKKTAPVTIVAFMDLQCPFCVRLYPPVQDVVKELPDKVNFVIKNFPLSFHQNALGAAKLALAAKEQGKYYEMVDLLLQNGASTTDEKINEYAQKLGLNKKKLIDDFKNKDAQWQKIISEDMDLAKQVGVGGTPTTFINGHRTSARDLPSFKADIERVLSEKRK